MKRRRFILLGGMAIGFPIVARAEQNPIPVIGYLWTATAEAAEQNLVAFRRGLGEAGYVEGRNVLIEYRMANGSYDRLPALAADLVDRNVALIVAISAPSAVAAKAATATIPVIFISADDPVGTGLIASLSRAGGNLTGVSFLLVELHPKRLEFLLELIPRAKVISLLLNPNNTHVESVMRQMTQAAEAKGVELAILRAGTENEIDAAFAQLADLHIDAVLVASDPFFNSRSAQIVTLAARQAAPAIYPFPEFVRAGGLIAYGPRLAAVNHEAGIYAGKILKGAKPADLPVVQPTKFELVINLKTAKALGLTVPQALLARADEVIE